MAAKKESGISIINNHISSNEFSNLYLLCGECAYLVNQFVDKLSNALVDVTDGTNYNVYKDNANVDEIISMVETLPFFADRRVVVVKNSGYFHKGNEALEKLFGNVPEETVLIFAEMDVDRRKTIFKNVQKFGTVAEFQTPDDKALVSWIVSLFGKQDEDDFDIKVYNGVPEKIIENLGQDMNIIYNEVKKLKAYVCEKGVVSVEDVEILSSSYVENKVFEMMDALSKKDKNVTIALYKDLMSLREPPMRILLLITRQFRVLAKVKMAMKKSNVPGEIAKAVGVPPFTVGKYIKQSDMYTQEQLIKCIDACQNTDTSIKTGIARDSVALSDLVLKLLAQGE